MIVIASLEHIGHGVGDIVNGGTRQSLRLQHVDRFVQLAARIFEVRCWTAHHGNEALEQVREASPVQDTATDTARHRTWPRLGAACVQRWCWASSARTATIFPLPKAMLISISQMKPLENGAWLRAAPCI